MIWFIREFQRTRMTLEFEMGMRRTGESVVAERTRR
jgi:hypothetical protein